MGERVDRPDIVSRRGFLANAGKIVVAAGAGAAGLTGIASAQTTQPAVPQYPWPYKKVDPDKVYWSAAALYYQYGCGQATFQALLNELGYPFTTVPTAVLRFGEGGVVGWGSHCGALLGSSAIISLVHGADPATSSKLITQLTGWYTEFIGSGSPLCHVSVTEWCKANGVTVESQERKDRCSRVAGEAAKKAALLLNAYDDTKAVDPTFGPRAAVVACQSCHGASAMGQVRSGVLQDCTMCHTSDPHNKKTN